MENSRCTPPLKSSRLAVRTSWSSPSCHVVLARFLSTEHSKRPLEAREHGRLQSVGPRFPLTNPADGQCHPHQQWHRLLQISREPAPTTRCTAAAVQMRPGVERSAGDVMGGKGPLVHCLWEITLILRFVIACRLLFGAMTGLETLNYSRMCFRRSPAFSQRSKCFSLLVGILRRGM